jgi:hypothetical protein
MKKEDKERLDAERAALPVINPDTGTATDWELMLDWSERMGDRSSPVALYEEQVWRDKVSGIEYAVQRHHPETLAEMLRKETLYAEARAALVRVMQPVTAEGILWLAAVAEEERGDGKGD